MNRREFLGTSCAAVSGLLAAAAPLPAQEPKPPAATGLRWKRQDALFVQVEADGRPLVPGKGLPLLDALVALGKDESGPKICLSAQPGDGKRG